MSSSSHSKGTTELREAPAPLEANDVATVTVGTVVWFALFLVQLPFYGWYADHGHAWWIWTCLAGGGLGLIGLWYVRARRDAIARARAAETAAGD
ncbi:DUF2530 domain-containing protein [Streptomyces sp. NPDC026673]|uniref:DUF2530 domain-containing protein n=1 Tax=Streptomyces sp. NPDC026673 TaxID=3155724 RepID=UPI003407B9BB